MKTKNKIYQGSSKTLYGSDLDFTLVMSFSDRFALRNGQILNLSGKGVINNMISSFIMSKLDSMGIENHFIKKLNMKEQLIQHAEVFPFSVSVAGIACGRYVKEFGLEEGFVFDSPLIDFVIRSPNYPIINEEQMFNFGWLCREELEDIKKRSIRIYDFLSGLFMGVGIRLVECRLEFGRVFTGDDFVIMLVDEISPDTCRLWDLGNNEKLCFEAVENGLESGIEPYRTVLKRLGA